MTSNDRDIISMRNIYDVVLSCFREHTNHYVPISTNIIPHPRAIGVVRVVIQVANIKRKLSKPRPSVLIGVQGRSETRSTTLEAKTYSPTWFAESTYIIIYSLQEDLVFKVLNHHRFFRTGIIGHSLFPLVLLKEESRRIGQELPIIKNIDKHTGTILFDIFYYPVSNPREITRPCDTGILTLQIQRAKDLKWELYARKPSKLIAITSLGWAEAPFHKTKASYYPDFPAWNSVFDFLCFAKASTIIVIKIAERYEGNETIVYGHLTLALNELLAAQDEGRVWWPLSGCPDGELRVTSEWKPIEIDRTSIDKAS